MDILYWLFYLILISIIINFAGWILIPAIWESKSSLNKFPSNFKNRLINKKNLKQFLSVFDYRTHLSNFLPYIVGFASFFIGYYLKGLNNLTSIFILTLTIILVFATLSLLTFTYSLVLNNRDRKVMKEEFMYDHNNRKALELTTESEEVQNQWIENKIEEKYLKSFNEEMIMKKVGKYSLWLHFYLL